MPKSKENLDAVVSPVEQPEAGLVVEQMGPEQAPPVAEVQVYRDAPFVPTQTQLDNGLVLVQL